MVLFNKEVRMFWNKKKKNDDKGLPDLPTTPKAIPSMKDFNRDTPSSNEPLPSLPDSKKEETHPLPVFPDSPTQKDFSQGIIKEAVEHKIDPKGDLPTLPPLPSSPRKSEMGALPGESKVKELAEEESPIPISPIRKPRIMEIEEWKPSQLSRPPIETSTKIHDNKPVFVRLDKFNDAKNSLDIIKEKIGNIDELLRTIKEAKIKEEHELASWEKEIESVKARINSIATEIFDSSIKS